jgi:4a-hydroxytetrahydrobiopterin dehydratase
VAWNVVDGHHLERTFTFPDFASGLAFVNAVGAIAEELDHHPDVYLGWGKVRLEIRTHSQGAITEKDTALADAIDRIPR